MAWRCCSAPSAGSADRDFGRKDRALGADLYGMARRSTALETAGGRVRTAVWTLAHPEVGRTVTLVGTFHIGHTEYFDELSALLARLAAGGAEIHVEGISRSDAEDLSDWELERLAEAAAWPEPETAGAAVALLHLDSQGAKLHLPAGARNVDLTEVDLLRRVGWKGYQRLFAPEAPPARAPALGPLARAFIRAQLRHSRSFDRLRSLRRSTRRRARVVLDERNAVAFAAAAEALGRHDVALVWGADHLPGLARLFRSSGYLVHREEWFEACRL